MNTPQTALEYLRKKGYSYWVVKASNGKTKGEYEGDDQAESVAEFQDLADNLMTGKYELTVRNSKSNYRGALTYDFEVYGNANFSQNKQNSTGMDAQLIAILIDLKTSVMELKMIIQNNQQEQDRRFKDLGKALADVFDEKEESKPLSPIEMLQGVKGLGDSMQGLKL